MRYRYENLELSDKVSGEYTRGWGWRKLKKICNNWVRDRVSRPNTILIKSISKFPVSWVVFETISSNIDIRSTLFLVTVQNFPSKLPSCLQTLLVCCHVSDVIAQCGCSSFVLYESFLCFLRTFWFIFTNLEYNEPQGRR